MHLAVEHRATGELPLVHLAIDDADSTITRPSMTNTATTTAIT